MFLFGKLILERNEKLSMVAHTGSPIYLGSWDRRIAWAQEFEAAVSPDHATALWPGQQT